MYKKYIIFVHLSFTVEFYLYIPLWGSFGCIKVLGKLSTSYILRWDSTKNSRNNRVVIIFFSYIIAVYVNYILVWICSIQWVDNQSFEEIIFVNGMISFLLCPRHRIVWVVILVYTFNLIKRVHTMKFHAQMFWFSSNILLALYSYFKMAPW